MKVSTFWHKAFLAALHRVSSEQARKEADEATCCAISAWSDKEHDFVPTAQFRGDLDIAKHSLELSQPKRFWGNAEKG